ncbi:MAG: PAS domain-containing protein, partial [Melioribacteraceae bacterium]|nr:PAS domain-containing protein [Melioribacteraceae bacterium]
MTTTNKTYNQLLRKTKNELIEELLKLKNGNGFSKNKSSLTFSSNHDLANLIVENSNDAIFIVGDKFKIEYVNRRAEEIFGVHAKDLVGSDFRKFLDFGTKSAVVEKHQTQRAE